MSTIQISNSDLVYPQWSASPETGLPLAHNTAYIWRVNVSEQLIHTAYFESLLAPDELMRRGKYFREVDKNRFLVSRASLRYLLGKFLNITPQSVTFSSGINKKPFIANSSEVQFNVSHSKNCILIALATMPVGVDVEEVNAAFNYTDVLNGHFSDAEIAYINQHNEPSRFFELWTRKEAMLKLTGKGLDEDLPLITALPGEHTAEAAIINTLQPVKVVTFKPDANYVGSVATSQIVQDHQFLDLRFL